MYDQTEKYETDIEPLVKKILAVCAMFKIPFFCSVAVKDTGTQTIYKNEMFGSVSENVALSDDQIVKHVSVANGFDTILHKSILECDLYEGLEDDLELETEE